MTHAHHSSHATNTAVAKPAQHPAINPEKYFRWRGGEITRLEAFCDVVFGFALTLLVVSLEVPHSYSDLIMAMRGFVPFALCFAQLVMIWLTHYRFSRRYGLQDAYTVFLNMVLLFVVLLYVYPLKFVFSLIFSQLSGREPSGVLTLHQGTVLMQIYGIGFALVFFLFVLMFAHAYALRDQLELNAAEVHETKMSIESNGILTLVGVISILIAFRSPEWAGWTFMLIGPALTIHGMTIRKKVRKLVPNG